MLFQELQQCERKTNVNAQQGTASSRVVSSISHRCLVSIKEIPIKISDIKTIREICFDIFLLRLRSIRLHRNLAKSAAREPYVIS